MMRQPKPAMSAPTRGAKRRMVSMASAFHHVDVFDGDRAAIAEETNEDGKADGRLGSGDRQHEKREHLPHQITQIRRKRDEVDIDRQEHQLDRHQQDDHVLAVQKQAENAYHEQGRRHREIMFKSDHVCPSSVYPPKYPFATRTAVTIPIATAVQVPAFIPRAPAPASHPATPSPWPGRDTSAPARPAA